MTIKSALITGCNRGIGFEFCKQLCQMSSTEHVIAITRRPQINTVFNAFSIQLNIYLNIYLNFYQ